MRRQSITRSLLWVSLGLGWGCASDPTSTTAPWADELDAETPAPRVFLLSEVPYYPRPGDDAALAERVAYSSRALTKLPPDYLHQRLQEAAKYSQVQRVAGPRPAKWPIGEAFTRLIAGSTDAHTDLIDALELEFVHAADTSALDLLGLELSARFREFPWEHGDYPGGPEGPNEVYAGTLADALDGVTPERRANRTAVSVITRSEATDAMWDYMLGQWTAVPGEDSKKLNRHAVPSYLAMREAAAADGVDLVILSGHRDPKRAAANAARVGNSFAVASFSSHSLGLAIDVELPRPTPAPGRQDTAENTATPSDSAKDTSGSGSGSGGGGGAHTHSGDEADDASRGAERFRLTTRPMADVVDMRRSPVHKWLHLHAHRFGWYPFQHEPWHWEYNPPAFRDVFFADYPEGPPRLQENE